MMGVQRFKQSELCRALRAWKEAGLEVGEAVILPDGTIRIKAPDQSEREPVNPADLVDP